MNVKGFVRDVVQRTRDLFRFGQTAPPGQVMGFAAALDAYRLYVSDGLTFAKLKSLTRAADSGDVGTTLALFEEMEEKDLHLLGVANTRRKALTGLDWEVVPDADRVEILAKRSQAGSLDGIKEHSKLADDAAWYVEDVLADLEGFDESLEHMATAIGPNLAVVEIVWEGNRPAALVPIPSHRLAMRPHESMAIRVKTAEAQADGIEAKPPKFIVHIPNSRAGFPFRCTVCQAQAFVYLIKLLAVADWAGYCEIFGQPVRWGTYPSNASADEKNEMLEMLKNMGSSAYGMFTEGFQLALQESSQRGTQPYEALINWVERKQSVGWLGQNLTTDNTGGTGSLATAKVHNDVRMDLVEDDVKREGRSIREQLIRPMIAYAFPGRDAPLPRFRRTFREEVDRQAEAGIIEASQRAGLKVPKDWAYERLGIPVPQEGEETLEPVIDPFGEGLNEEVGSGTA